MKRIVPAHVDSPFEFRIREARIEDAAPAAQPSKRRPAVMPASQHRERHQRWRINPLDRIALLGPNGAGQIDPDESCLRAKLAPLDGPRAFAVADLAIGYFAQQQMEQLEARLRMRSGIVRNLPAVRILRAATNKSVRDHLGRFGFDGRSRVPTRLPDFPVVKRRV